MIIPTIPFQGRTSEGEVGGNLRQVFLQHGLDLYNNQAMIINCQVVFQRGGTQCPHYTHPQI